MAKLLSRLNLDLLIKIGVAAIILAVPLYPKFPFLTIPLTYVSIRLEDFLIFAVAGIWILKVIKEKIQVLQSPVAIAIILFLIVALVSVASGIFLTDTVPLHLGILHWGRRVEYFLAFFIAISSIKSKRDLEFYIKCIGIVILIAFIFGAGQKYFAWPVITTQNTEYSKGVALRYMPGGHLVSTFAGHYDLAAFIVLTSPVLFALLFSTPDTLKSLLKIKVRNTRIIIAVLIAASLWLLLNAASRISVAGYLGSVVLALFFARRYKFIPIVIAITLIGAILTGNLSNRYLRIFEVTFKNIFKTSLLIKTVNAQEVLAATPVPTSTPIPVFEDRSTSIRLNVEWPRAIRALTKNPLLGTGFSSITLATDNDYLRLLGEVGLLGFFAWALIIVRILLYLIKKLPFPKQLDLTNAYLVGIVSAIPGILLTAVFIDIFEASKFAIMFWLALGFAFALPKINAKTN